MVYAGLAITGWYLFQIGTRRKESLQFATKKFVAALAIFALAVFVINSQHLSPSEVVVFAFISVFAAPWGALLLVKQPSRSRQIPKRMRRPIIARDLSKGVTWNGDKHHIDHVVPFCRGGDHSLRNLRVIEKTQNLRKGAKLPGLKDLLD